MRTGLGIIALTAAYAMPGHAQELDCRDPQTQVEMTGCAARDYEAADAELNAAWGEAMAWARRMDEGLPADQVPAADILRDAQRAWIPFRDQACEAESLAARGGTMQNMLFYMCLTRLTEVRTEDLRNLGLE